MSDNMGELDSVLILKKKLLESLGESSNAYLRVVKKWFKMKISKEQLETELNSLLNPGQKQLHKLLLLHLLHKVPEVHKVESDTVRPKYCYRNLDRVREGFEPVDPTMYDILEREELEGEPPPSMVQEKMLPDSLVAHGLLLYSAWELGIDNVNKQCADFLAIATQNFLKNVLTAIVSRKKGYKCNSNGFIHNLGCATPNPWLHNVAKRKATHFHPLEFEGLVGRVKPAERPSKEEYEHDAVFRLSATRTNKEAGPISLQDVLITIQMYPALIASEFVRIVTLEKLYAKIVHPVYDD